MVDKKQEWKPFEDARVFVRSLKLRGAEEWEEYRKSGKRPNDIPSNPDKIYKNDGWISIPDWLGNEPMKGRKLSEEHRRKIGEAMKGHTVSEESKRKMSESAKVKIFSEEHRRKIGKAWKNRESVSDRTKRKMSDSHREAQNRPEQKERVSKWRANLKIPRKDTNPEIILQQICNDEGIEFVTQKVIKLQHYDWHAHGSTFVDVFIEPNICLFADGDYWHANPNPYMVNKRIKPGIKPDTVLLSSSKQKRIAKDVREKDAGISLDLMQQGYIVIRFWESDLKYDKEKCRQEVIDVVRKSKE